MMMWCISACGNNETKNNASTEPGNVTVEESNDKDKAVFEEIVVVDNDECTIKVTDLDKNGFWGYTVKAEFENKSDNKTYMYSVLNASIDGLQADPFFASEVAAGKKSIETISFTNEELKDETIEFTDIQMSFTVSDSDDWTADPVAEETIHIYPFGEENAKKFERAPQETDTILIDNNKVSVILTDIDENGFWGYTLNLFIENKTDKEIMISCEDVSINGYMADPFYAATVGSNMCAFSSIFWYDEDLESIGILDSSEIEEIEMILRAYDYNNWNAKDYAKEKITITP